MDPLTLASAFATIVHLLGVYALEHKDVKGLDHQKFVEWLQYHKHEQLVTLICNTAAIQSEVDKLLRQDHALMMAKLDAIDTTLASLLSRVEGFGGLASAMVPSAQLSEQAISLLRQLIASKQRNLIFGEIQGGYILQPEGGEPFEYSDPLFLSDDIDTLERFGFLTRRESGDAYTKIYGITRAAAQFIRVVGGAPASP